MTEYPLHDVWFWILNIGRASLTGFIAMLVYIFSRNYNIRSTRKNLARTLIIEIDDNRETVDAIVAGNKAISAPILRGVYDGIVIQGNIQHFDSDIQSKMQYLYKCLDEKKIEPLPKLFAEILIGLGNIDRRNCRVCFFQKNIML